MTISRIGIAFAVSCLVATPSVFAQHTSSGSSSGSAGTAVARGGDGGGGSTGGSGSSAGGSSMGESGGGASGRAAARSAGAWSHGAETRAAARTASTRGAMGEGSARAGTAYARSRSAASSSGSSEIPPYSRPGAGRPTVGQAVPRGSVQPSGSNNMYSGSYVSGYPYGLYGGYGYYGYPSFGYVYGASMFGPYGYWDDDPTGLYGLGVYDPYSPTQAFIPVGPGSTEEGGAASEPKGEGALRFSVKPLKASVYVDGSYVGLVKQYDSVFKKLHLGAGPHEVQIKADGYEPVTFHVRIEPGQTEIYKGELDKK